MPSRIHLDGRSSLYFLPLFLLGLAAIRSGLIDDPERYRSSIRRLMWWMLAGGLSSIVVGWVSWFYRGVSPSMTLGKTVYEIHSPTMMLAYACAIAPSGYSPSRAFSCHFRLLEPHPQNVARPEVLVGMIATLLRVLPALRHILQSRPAPRRLF